MSSPAKHRLFSRAGQRGAEGHGPSVPGQSGRLSPAWSRCCLPAFLGPAVPRLCPQLLPAGQGTLLRHLQHQNTGTGSSPMASSLDSDSGRDGASAGQAGQGDSPRSPQHGAAPAQSGEQHCSRHHRGSAASKKQGRLWPWCSRGGDGGAGTSPHSQPPPTAAEGSQCGGTEFPRCRGHARHRHTCPATAGTTKLPPPWDQ